MSTRRGIDNRYLKRKLFFERWRFWNDEQVRVEDSRNDPAQGPIVNKRGIGVGNCYNNLQPYFSLSILIIKSYTNVKKSKSLPPDVYIKDEMYIEWKIRKT